MFFSADFLRPRDGYVRAFGSDRGLSEARAELEEAGIFVAQIDGRSVVSADSLFDALSSALRFPAYFGRNWDAVIDCLRDFGWLPSVGYLLVVDHADDMFRSAPRTAATFIEVCGYAAEFWREEDRPFHLVLLTGETAE